MKTPLKMNEPQTPMQIADGIREVLKKDKLCVANLPDRRAMALVVEHLSSVELKRVRFQFPR